MGRIERLTEALMTGIAYCLGGAFLLALLLNVANVAGRYGLGQSILGADEAQIFVMIWMTFVGAAVVTWRRQHLRMDILLNRLGPPARRMFHIVESLLVLALSGVVVSQSWRYVAQMIEINRRSDALQIPIALPHAAVVAGFVGIFLVTLVRLGGLLAARSSVAAPKESDT